MLWPIKGGGGFKDHARRIVLDFKKKSGERIEKKESSVADGRNVSGSGEIKVPKGSAVDKGKPFNSAENVKNIVEAEIQSSESYHEVVSDIVSTAKEQLEASNGEKTGIRRKFLRFFVVMLILQFASVVAFLTLSATESVKFLISDSLMQIYVGSVFVETLGEVGIMIKFAFDSKDEVKIIELLTAVVNNYQKFHR